MRWDGHLVWMEDGRLPKQQFYKQLQWGKRPRHKPKKRFKDVIKNNLKTLGINFEGWERTATNRTIWRRLVYDICRRFEAMRLDKFILKRVLRKWQRSNLDTFPTFRPDWSFESYAVPWWQTTAFKMCVHKWKIGISRVFCTIGRVKANLDFWATCVLKTNIEEVAITIYIYIYICIYVCMYVFFQIWVPWAHVYLKT